jgi:hypothetical protein
MGYNMSISKEMRYAMIRRAVKKVQKSSKVIASNKRLAKEVERLNNENAYSEIEYKDTESYVNAHFFDTYQANTTNEETYNG